ncbi:MAG: DUF1801 domain-containing protein [Bacteroidia bacterium]|nr:DUF1801 domain-containing protein [Bacteroidia bacterium]
MTTKNQIQTYFKSQPESKNSDMQALHKIIIKLMPACKLWCLDGKNTEGKILSNPNIGYGHYTINYKDGTTKEFYQIGLSANTTGISVYIMGLDDKTYLTRNYGNNLGKATVTGYCIKFKSLKQINIDTLIEAVRYGIKATEKQIS